ncbi:hypothetical protein ABZ721_23710 [Streptomyces sp. NPDC006733]|uniref:hypothetical protein n=1 Tax=Streptomyces sp. NPDC006733 TaxID=3155460 RepID=UPI0033F782F3
MNALVRLDRRLGSARLRSAAEAELTLITTLISDSTYDAGIAAGLYAVAATAAGVSGWIAYDSGDQTLAEARYTIALSFAKEAAWPADVELRTYLAALLAHQQCAVGELTTALHLLQAEDDTVRRGWTSPRTEAAFHLASARVHATLRNAQASFQSIDAARRALQHNGVSLPTMLNSWVTPVQLELEAGYDLLALGLPRQALPYFDVLHTEVFPAQQDVRQSSILFTAAATAHLQTGDLDAAVACARHAQAFLVAVESTRATQRLSGLRRILMAHQQAPAVRAYFDEIE